MIVLLMACVESPSLDVELTIDTEGEVPTFDWSGGAMHELRVGVCEGTCTCEDGWLVFKKLTKTWDVGPSPYIDPDALAQLSPFMQPPVTYGQEFFENERYVGPLPLEEGITHAAEVQRFEPDELNGSGAVVDAHGCILFVP